ncbi:Uncharacterized protein Fot_12226 [Forsythia ovata]|uniref:Uncharacterized protein n=1 Tax=Forsythia ovata TaxID=205694 RepID=A0ABD1WLX6_9LAMI
MIVDGGSESEPGCDDGSDGDWIMRVVIVDNKALVNFAVLKTYNQFEVHSAQQTGPSIPLTEHTIPTHRKKVPPQRRIRDNSTTVNGFLSAERRLGVQIVRPDRRNMRQLMLQKIQYPHTTPPISLRHFSPNPNSFSQHVVLISIGLISGGCFSRWMVYSSRPYLHQ